MSAQLKKGYAVVAILLVMVVVVILLVMTKPEQPAIESKQKIWPIEAIKVDVGKMAPVQTLYGTVESNEMVTAASPVSGVVDMVWVKEGDAITIGQKLVALAPADIELPYQIAKADVADTQAQIKLQDLAYQANKKRLDHEQKVLEIKRKDVSRNEDLIKKDLISKSTLDKSKEALVRQEFAVVGAELSVQENKAKVDQLKARLQKAKANLEQAKLNRQRGVVEAPYAGRIAKVLVAKGDRVTTNSSLISFYSLDSLELRAKIPVNQLKMVYQSVQQNIPVSALFTIDGEVFDLPLKRLAGESSTSGVDAFFEIPTELKIIRPGDLLKVQLKGQVVENTFAVPYSALYGSDRIYTVEDGTLQLVKVELLGETLVDGQVWALLQGDLAQGAMVATTHLPNAISGLKVNVMESADD